MRVHNYRTEVALFSDESSATNVTAELAGVGVAPTGATASVPDERLKNPHTHTHIDTVVKILTHETGTGTGTGKSTQMRHCRFTMCPHRYRRRHCYHRINIPEK